MKITFLGATKMVTGSNFLVEAAGKKFLVDCGMYQGKATQELENSDPFVYDVNDIDFMDRYGGYLHIGLYDTIGDMICIVVGSFIFIVIMKKRLNC